MRDLPNVRDERRRVRTDVLSLFKVARAHLRQNPRSHSAGLGRLFALRKDVYEHLNQLQHEGLLLDAIAWLEKHARVPRNVTWAWHPRQTSGKGEADLRATAKGKILLYAEATAAAKPQGTITARLRKALRNLPKCKAKKHYCFVRTTEMATAAKRIASIEGLRIAVVCLPFTQFE